MHLPKALNGFNPFYMKIYKFLASYRFALLLIFLSALCVAIGTFLESKTDSHQLAEEWIYHHPLFQILLGGYFLNILLSALSRYPFKKSHIPFLITHLGLLMLILGTFIKSRYGVQGHIHLIEGTATDYYTDPKNKIPESTYKALYWIANLFEEEHFLEHLKAKGWPLIDQLEIIHEKEEQYLAWMRQILAIQDQLPSPDKISPLIAERMNFAYQKLANILEHRIKLPFSVRLHQARDIKYPGSDQTASYECSLSLNSTPCTLRMNQVHETPEGYRLYLASIGEIDRYGVRSVQLVVNHDPAKRILTYPGGALVSLGILLLFFRGKPMI